MAILTGLRQWRTRNRTRTRDANRLAKKIKVGRLADGRAAEKQDLGKRPLAVLF
jgi:hypothetical protein